MSENQQPGTPATPNFESVPSWIEQEVTRLNAKYLENLETTKNG